MRIATISLAAALLAGCAAVPAPQQAPLAGTLAPLPESVISELPRNARPYHYTIEVAPDAADLSFTGFVVIDLELFEPSQTITVHSNKLTISRARVVPAAGGAGAPLTVALDADAETATFAAPDALAAGRYRLEIDYSGPIGRQPSGFFALDYPDKRTGETVRGLFTQFEVPDAREFAPMFDEPSYKATFDVSAVVPASQMAVSNMPVMSEEPLGGGKKRVRFATSPKMSSYLLFLGVGDFERLSEVASDGTEIGIVAPTGSGETARYALNVTKPLMAYYADYFGVPYPLPKLDNVAAPGSSQQFGAMENWGAILTFERYLLLDPKNTSPSIQQYLEIAAAHEVAHQWFGNIVTMSWWNDLWLNEGFASWMETKATARFRPDWHMDVGRVNGRETAMALDSLASTHPIVLDVPSAKTADEAFDAIAYSKGEAVITMLEAFAGEDIWRDGIRRYMKRHAYDNTVTSDLWRAVEEAGAKGLQDVAEGFTLQAGVPLVRASATCRNGSTVLALTQGQFSRDQQDKFAADPARWKVPMTVRAADGSLHPLLLDGRAEVGLPGCGPVIVNGGQKGYFRTLYTPQMMQPLAASLDQLSDPDQLGLVRDNLALSDAGYQDYAPALDLLTGLEPDANPVVAESAVPRWGALYGVLEDEQAKDRMSAHVRSEWYPRLQQLGFDPREGESVADLSLRSQLVATLGAMEVPEVVAEARRRFARLDSDPTALDGPLKTTWLNIVSNNATTGDWELIRRLAARSGSSVERTLLLGRLGNVEDEALARRALALALSGEVEPTDGAQIVASVAGNHPDMTFDWMLQNQGAVDAMLDDSSRWDFVATVVRASTDPAMVAKLEALREARPEEGRGSVDRALVSLRQRLASYPRTREQLAAWLAARG
ncbi:MAG: M1 family metallopeptidase [Croceibacterium sp.]